MVLPEASQCVSEKSCLFAFGNGVSLIRTKHERIGRTCLWMFAVCSLDSSVCFSHRPFLCPCIENWSCIYVTHCGAQQLADLQIDKDFMPPGKGWVEEEECLQNVKGVCLEII